MEISRVLFDSLFSLTVHLYSSSLFFSSEKHKHYLTTSHHLHYLLLGQPSSSLTWFATTLSVTSALILPPQPLFNTIVNVVLLTLSQATPLFCFKPSDGGIPPHSEKTVQTIQWPKLSWTSSYHFSLPHCFLAILTSLLFLKCDFVFVFVFCFFQS